ncbi:MAG: hypothetical protein ACE5HL_09045 [Terriglobia bacterium]
MHHKATIASFLLAGLSVFAIAAVAQHAQHHPEQTNPTEESKGKSMMSGGMMSGGMMSGGMMARHQEMQTLLGQLVESFATLEGALADQRVGATAKQRLAEHRALLEQLQSKLTHRSEMMQKMMEKKDGCPMMGGKEKQG